MTKPIFVFILAWVISDITVFGDVNVLVQFDSLQSEIPWNWGKAQASLQINSEAALHGQYGLRVAQAPDTESVTYCNVRLRFPYAKSWLRFYFMLDTISLVKSGSTDTRVASDDMLCYNFSGDTNQYFNILLGFGRLSNSRSAELHCGILTSERTLQTNFIRVPIRPNRSYCAEISTSFSSRDSSDFELILDGVVVGRMRVLLPFTPQQLQVVIRNLTTPNLFWSASLDDFVVTNTRSYPIPPKPIRTEEKPSYRKTLLQCSRPETFYQGENIIYSDWRLFTTEDTLFPVYQFIKAGDSAFNTPIPFALDSGNYAWQVRFRNNFDVWGEWSDKRIFAIKENRYKTIRFKDFIITEQKKADPITEIVPGRWYDFHVRLEPQIPWSHIAYMIVNLRHPSYVSGSVNNKGGCFFRQSNYVYNFCFGVNKYSMFEKNHEGSLVSTPLFNEKRGLYIDGRQKELFIDTLNGHIRFHGRLLGDALPGTWQATIHLVDIKDNLSNVGRKYYTIQKPESRSFQKKYLLLLFALVPVVILIPRFWKKKVSDNSGQESVLLEKDYQRIEEYVAVHLQGELTMNEIRAALFMSKNGFYKTMNAKQVKLPVLVNTMRIKKAKEILLADKGLSLSEVAFQVGYNDPNYFIKIFKSMEGVNPKDYRRMHS